MTPDIKQALMNALDSGAIIITSSHRQKRFIQDFYNRQQQTEAWENIECLTWTEWLQQHYESLQWQNICTGEIVFPALINADESNWILQQSVEKNRQAIDALNETQFNAIEKYIIDAYQLYQNWCLDIEAPEQNSYFKTTEETRLFLDTLKTYQSICHEKQVIDSLEIIHFIIKNNLKIQSAHKEIILYGFIELNPLQQRWINYLKNHRLNINLIEITNSNHPESDNFIRYSFKNKKQEWIAAAKWARKKSEFNPEMSIAVIVPELANYHSEIFRIFKNVFQPQSQLKAERVIANGFNFSAGEVLSELPLMKSIINWINLLNYTSKENWIHFLMDEFSMLKIADNISLSNLSENIKNCHNDYVSVQRLLDLIQSLDAKKYQHMTDFLQKLQQVFNQTRKFLYVSEWLELLENQLEDTGWPNYVEVDTVIYQQLTKWQQVKNSLVYLDNICGKISFSKFRKLVIQKLDLESFQLETPKARVQVLGYLESVGLAFDEVRITGCQDTNFPGKISPNPFLPISLQKKYQVANGSQERELNYAMRVFASYINSNKDIHFSYARNDSESELLPSPFILEFPERTPDEIQQFPEEWISIKNQVLPVLKPWDDPVGAPFVEKQAKRGISILKDQALCPFRAYVAHRLYKEETVEEFIGISPLQRGNWMHHIMEHLWLRFKSLSGLQNYSLEAMNQEVDAVVEEVILNKSRNPEVKQDPVNLYEVERTKNIVKQWFEFDRNRESSFSVVTEKQEHCKILDLEFNVRIDRIDTFENDQQLIIDYKTGAIHPGKWNFDRIEEPQLPLYALLNPDKTSAIAFVKLAKDRCEISGVGDSHVELPGVNTDENWENLLRKWQNNLENVAEEFLQGVATVTPQKDACNYCEYQSVCRINTDTKDHFEVVHEPSSEPLPLVNPVENES